MMLSYSRWAAAASAARAGPLRPPPSASTAAKAALSSLGGRGSVGVGPEPSPPPPGRSGRERRQFFSSAVSKGVVSSTSSFGVCRKRRIAEFSTAVAADAAAPTDSSAVAAETQPPPFSKILIANRGEIALRVIKTCRSLGIRTVAVHSTVDYRSPHVLAADESVCVGPAASSESYLNVDAVCKAVADTGAQAVHPGYGFLSENAEFARRVAEMGAAFIGPSSDAIVAMGDKIQSKKLAREAKVNVIPGYDGVISSPEEAVKIAEEVGYPVMIKATAGGGGKGMRICHNAEQVVEGYHLSTAEAKSFFSDDRLFIERYIEDPHHIEIQVLAGRKRLESKSSPESVPMGMNTLAVSDGEKDDERYGPLEILCFPERECSIQRRNQKIIEESPSTLLTPATRAEMVRQVKSLVRRVNYQSAGTVEFLVDEKQNFYFLEMNTRLQVEHPVTEMVSGGVDLVRGMIDVAGGRGVPEDYLALVGRDGSVQDSSGEEGILDEEEKGRVVPHSGHAIEARIYAEDPLRGFLPSIGPLLSYVEPPCISHTPTYSPSDDSDIVDSEDGSVVRIDSGVTAGSQISQYYDPMISKLVAFSPRGRDDAIRALGRALDRYVIRGVGHNASFASDVLRHPQFIEGRTPTNFIEKNYPEGFGGVQLTEGEREELAVVGAALSREKERSVRTEGSGREDGGEEVIAILGGMFGDAYRVKLDAGDGPATVEKLPPRPSGGETVPEEEAAPSRSVSVSVPSYDPVFPVAEVLVDSNPRSIQVGSPYSSDKDGALPLQMYGASVPVLILSPREYELSLLMLPPAIADTSDMVLSPMPGTLVSYAVEEGERVEVGQEICVVEAMKMQNVIRAERAGIVSRRKAEVGESLMADEVIVEFEKEGEGQEEVA